MSKELPKAYEPQKYEDEIYKKWEESGFFNPDNLDLDENAESYTIAIPPPNVTGTLHIGHALVLTIEDILTRFHRMRGYRALWLPGTDHAAIATQTKVEKIIKEEGIDRHKLGRENFLERVNKFAQESHDTIINQVKKMGSSCDWSREAYTLDETRNKAVRSVFKMMYDDGLIYRGERIVNWCPRCHSTLADDEVEYKAQKGVLYYFKYDKNFPITIATTRPETKLGDTAVAVNPKDERYKKYIGEEFDVNFCGIKLKIKIIADRKIDMKFGTGALGVTPAHSQVDWQMAEEQNLEIKKVIDEDGNIRDDFAEFSGKKVFEARKMVVEKLKKQGLIEKEEEIENNLSLCYRCDTPIEPLPSLQWFIDVNKKISKYKKSIKELSVYSVKSGVFGREKIKIVPERFEKNYFHWMENLRDWCISRQIWFGHQVPVWYKEGETYVGVEEPEDKTNFIFLHAFKASADEDFWPWLRSKMNGKKIFSPNLPNPSNPKIEEQINFVFDNTEINENSIIVGHSLGCVLAMKLIAEKNIKIKKLILVTPPLQSKKFVDGKKRPVLEECCDWNFDFEKIKKLVDEVVIFKDNNDPVVFGNEPVEISKKLNGRLIKMEAPKPHFNSSEFLEIFEELKKDTWLQDEDTLDTWFSSGLWTFSTLASSPDQISIKDGKLNIDSEDFKNFHPTSVLETGYDILFFWVARMIIMTTYAIGDIPFQDVYLHGLVLDEKGKKMSKSKGNVIDPLDMTKKYGADATRLSLIIGSTPGNDMCLSEEKIAGFRNFVNKLWNISRYIITNYELGITNYEFNFENLTLFDKWVLFQLRDLIMAVADDLENYRFSQAAERIREFTWDNLADWYLEVCKFEKNEQKSQILEVVLNDLLKILHPFVPFVTEVIWNELGNKSLLMVEKYPTLDNYKKIFEQYNKGDFNLEIITLKNIITAIRNARTENKIEPSKKIKAIIYAGKQVDLIKSQEVLIKSLRTGIEELEIEEKGEKIDDAIYVAVGEVEIYLVGAVDPAKERARIEKEIENKEKVIAGVENKLKNKEFVEKAPKEIVEKEKERLKLFKEELKNLKIQIKKT